MGSTAGRSGSCARSRLGNQFFGFNHFCELDKQHNFMDGERMNDGTAFLGGGGGGFTALRHFLFFLTSHVLLLLAAPFLFDTRARNLILMNLKTGRRGMHSDFCNFFLPCYDVKLWMEQLIK